MKFLVALIAGALSAFAFQPFGFMPLMVIAFAVLTGMLASMRRVHGALGLGWCFGVGQFTVGLNWIATAFTFQVAMPAWLGWLAVVLLSFYLAVYTAIATGLALQVGRHRPIALVFALGGAWIVGEWLRATMFTGFAWNPVGVTLVGTPLMRAGGFIGTYGLSGLVVLIGGALWLGLARMRDAGIVIAVPLTAGLATFALPHPPATKGPLVKIVQPNIGQDNRWQPGAAQKNIAKQLALSGPPDAEPRLLLWPESAVTIPLEDDRRGTELQVAELRRSVTRALGPRDLLAAGSEGLASTDGTRVTSARNSTFVLGPGGTFVGRYDKAHLVPYGEYLPMRPLLSAIGLSRLAPGDLDFDSGPGPRTLTLPGFGKMGLQICYEIIFSGQVVDRANRPDFLFNPSNDSWFGSWGPPQHLAQARLRAAEEGIPVLRATPTGVSAIVDADGAILHSIPLDDPGVIEARLPAPRAATPFAKLGNILPMLMAVILLVAGGIGGRRKGRPPIIS